MTTAEFEGYKVRVHNVLKQQKSKTTAQSDGDTGKIERWALNTLKEKKNMLSCSELLTRFTRSEHEPLPCCVLKGTAGLAGRATESQADRKPSEPSEQHDGAAAAPGGTRHSAGKAQQNLAGDHQQGSGAPWEVRTRYLELHRKYLKDHVYRVDFFLLDHLSIVCQNLQAAVCSVRERDPALRCVPGPDRPVLPDRDPAPDLQRAAEEAAGRPPGHRGDPAGAADSCRGAALQPAESEQ